MRFINQNQLGTMIYENLSLIARFDVINRNNLSAEMSKSEIEEAQKLARERLKKRHNFAYCLWLRI
jgi:hypothetical protein